MSEAQFKNNGLINLAEEISRQHSIQAVEELLHATFSQVCRENQEQKAKQKDLNNLHFGQKKY
jgi:hypothetical protein